MNREFKAVQTIAKGLSRESKKAFLDFIIIFCKSRDIKTNIFQVNSVVLQLCQDKSIEQINNVPNSLSSLVVTSLRYWHGQSPKRSVL